MLDKKIQKELICKGRAFTKGYRENDPYMEAFESDQTLKLIQPPLVKAPMAKDGNRIPLPRDFSDICRKPPLWTVCT